MFSTELQHLSLLLPDWKQINLVYMLFAVAVGFLIGRATVNRVITFQNRGETLLSQAVLANFGAPDYHLMNHVTLPMKDGTTQIDHILVSRFGVFVIETKHYKGWIFGNAQHSTWTQVLFKAKFKFQNPIKQNLRHVSAVQKLLDFLPPDVIRSVVVFTGEAKLQTEVPPEVFSSLSGFLEYLRQQTIEAMSINRVQFCVGRIETARLAITGKTDVEHIESLTRRHCGTS